MAAGCGPRRRRFGGLWGRPYPLSKHRCLASLLFYRSTPHALQRCPALHGVSLGVGVTTIAPCVRRSAQWCRPVAHQGRAPTSSGLAHLSLRPRSVGIASNSSSPPNLLTRTFPLEQSADCLPFPSLRRCPTPGILRIRVAQIPSIAPAPQLDDPALEGPVEGGLSIHLQILGSKRAGLHPWQEAAHLREYGDAPPPAPSAGPRPFAPLPLGWVQQQNGTGWAIRCHRSSGITPDRWQGPALSHVIHHHTGFPYLNLHQPQPLRLFSL